MVGCASQEDRYQEQVKAYEKYYDTIPRANVSHLLNASSKGLDMIVQNILDAGTVNINDVVYRKVSPYVFGPPLTLADYKCAKLLIENGADVNKEWVMPIEGKGMTTNILFMQFALPWEGIYRHLDKPEEEALRKIKLLLDNGAIVENKEAYTTVAQQMGNHQLAAFAKTLGKKKACDEHALTKTHGIRFHITPQRRDETDRSRSSP